MSKKTAATSTVQITSSAPVLMLALELGEEKWKLGFCPAFGQAPLERNMASRNRTSLLAQIAWAKKKLALPAEVRVVSGGGNSIGTSTGGRGGGSDRPNCGARSAGSSGTRER